MTSAETGLVVVVSSYFLSTYDRVVRFVRMLISIVSEVDKIVLGVQSYCSGAQQVVADHCISSA